MLEVQDENERREFLVQEREELELDVPVQERLLPD
jgi:hypothetical protein